MESVVNSQTGITRRLIIECDGEVMSVDLEDNQTVDSLLALLPLELTFRDFANKEKIANLKTRLQLDSKTGMKPTVGDFFLYLPWGNLGFFYDAEGSEHSRDLVRLGTTSQIEGIRALEGKTAILRLDS